MFLLKIAMIHRVLWGGGIIHRDYADCPPPSNYLAKSPPPPISKGEGAPKLLGGMEKYHTNLGRSAKVLMVFPNKIEKNFGILHNSPLWGSMTNARPKKSEVGLCPPFPEGGGANINLRLISIYIYVYLYICSL